ncbi:MAG: carboxypeptidase-like regulatory domain-containing protein [Bacteroidetes bacterium]|nr:carboxypeptidase-like regulatory domain-containing protein [Bacteroidota bacterium]
MKVSLLLISVFVLGNFLFAQQSNKNSGTLKISAKVIDASNKLPIEYATVTLLNDSSKKAINGAISNKKGIVEIQNVIPGKYSILIQYLGYEDYSQKILLQADLALSEVLLHKKAVELNNVTVSSTRKIIENRLDKMVYNLDKDITSQGGIATDALKKIPGVTVDIDGNVEFNRYPIVRSNR